MLTRLQNGLRPREPRIAVIVPARMRLGTQWVDVVIHNVSSRGLMAGCDQPPATGSYVELRRGTLVIVGRVVWAKNRFFGLRAQDRLSAKALVEEPRLASRPDAAERAGADRRSTTRLEHEQRLARQMERSRAFAAAFQFVLLVGTIAVVGWLAASTVCDMLGRPMQAVERAMAGKP